MIGKLGFISKWVSMRIIKSHWVKSLLFIAFDCWFVKLLVRITNRGWNIVLSAIEGVLDLHQKLMREGSQIIYRLIFLRLKPMISRWLIHLWSVVTIDTFISICTSTSNVRLIQFIIWVVFILIIKAWYLRKRGTYRVLLQVLLDDTSELIFIGRQFH